MKEESKSDIILVEQPLSKEDIELINYGLEQC